MRYLVNSYMESGLVLRKLDFISCYLHDSDIVPLLKLDPPLELLSIHESHVTKKCIDKFKAKGVTVNFIENEYDEDL